MFVQLSCMNKYNETLFSNQGKFTKFNNKILLRVQQLNLSEWRTVRFSRVR